MCCGIKDKLKEAERRYRYILLKVGMTVINETASFFSSPKSKTAGKGDSETGKKKLRGGCEGLKPTGNLLKANKGTER